MRVSVRNAIVALIAGAAAIGPALSDRTEEFVADPAWWAAGNGEGAVVDRDGSIRLGRTLGREVRIDGSAVWGVAGDWIGASDPGALLRRRESDVRVVRPLGEGEWISVVAADDGGVRYAVSPTGELRRARGDADRPWITLEASFVWDLVRQPDGAWIVATGDPGGVTVVRGERAETVLTFDEGESARTLAVGEDGTVWIGTSRGGQLWRWTPAGEPFLAGALDGREVVGLVPDGAGGAFVVHTAAATPSPAAAKPPAAPARAGATGAVRVTVSANPSGGSAGDANGAKPAPAKPASGKANGATLTHWTPAEGFRDLWSIAEETAFAAAPAGDGVWIGTGPEGRLRRVDVRGIVREGYRLPCEQVTALDGGAGGTLHVGCSRPAAVLRLEASTATEGVWRSPVVDAGSPARWGHVSAALTGDARLDIRVGNTTKPGPGWTPWAKAGGDALQALPLARWSQLRVTLRAGREAPSVRDVRGSYGVRNRTPRLTSLDLRPPGEIWFAGPAPGRPPGGPVFTDDAVARETRERVRSAAAGAVRKAYEAGARTAVWTADDPDGDDLTAELALIDASGRRIPIHAGPSTGFHSWDARALPEGRYRLRLTLSDPSGASDTRTTTPFLNDRTPPSFEPLRGSGTTRWRVRDAGGLRAIEAWDGVRWRPIEPEDGLVDGDVETIRIPDGGPRWFRATDRAGNVSGRFHEKPD